MSDMRVGKTLFETGDEASRGDEFHTLSVHEDPEVPGGVRLRIANDWFELTAEQATTLAVALNNHSYPHICPRR